MASDIKTAEADSNADPGQTTTTTNDDNNTELEAPPSYEPPSPLTGCYLLIILGEPHSAEHKDIILQRLLKGLLSWNILDVHVDLEEELHALTTHAPDGEAARHGERLIQYASENLVIEILIHPQYNTLIQCMRNLLSSFTRHRHIIHSGYTFSGNGSWILQDATFSVSDFAEAMQDYEVQRVIRAYPDTISMEISCAASGYWTSLPDRSYARLCKIRINSVDILDSGSEKLNAFIDYLAPMLVPASLNDLMESSDVVGNIRFSHPTLYVFPGGQGDAALFGINGFNMLVDGGFTRKSCFWDFTRHLDRLDAVLMTRINNSNIQGLCSIIERKRHANVYPQIGHFFTNIPELKPSTSAESDKDSDPLLVNLFERGQALTSNLKSINLQPQTCYKDIEPINLYHKVGHGTLDMYVISPAKDSKEVKEFLQKWKNRDQSLFATKHSRDFQFPMQNLVSICAMLVWLPADPEDTITRILFPGSTPDYKIMEGLDKMKHLEFMKHPTCTANTLVKSYSSNILSKKLLKSALVEKSPPTEPILPSKTTTKPIAAVAIQEKDNKIASDTKTTKSSAERDVKSADSDKDNKVSAKIAKADESKVDNKSAAVKEVKSRVDSKPPKSMDKKLKKDSSTEKKEVGKSSPISTPKKEPKQTNGTAKEPKAKAVSRVTKSSPSSTPAKSTKEANNRKVLESKQKTVKSTKKEVTTTATEKKEVKTERKPISRRPKAVAGSPIKSVKSKAAKDGVRKPKADKGAASDSSVVSTPSAADDGKGKKGPELEKQILLDDLKEEEEAVREIEAVLKRSELREERDKVLAKYAAEIEKQDSTTEADDEEEYIIIEKEEVEQYTEDSVNEQESSVTGKEDEIQKHQRDSEESEKKRKPSLETTEEEKEAEINDQTVDIDQPTIDNIPTVETEEVEQQFDEKRDSVTEIEKVDEDKLAADDAKDKGDEELAKTDEFSPSPEEKVPSVTKKTSDTKDDVVEQKEEPKDAEVEKPPESQPFSATVESGATTAPTLPEDEHVTLDEIKEDVVIEEKYIKEETKESHVAVTAPQETVVVAKPTHIDLQQPHLRDVIKTPDEVADLPVHEEADLPVHEEQQVKTEKVTEKTETIEVTKTTVETKEETKEEITVETKETEEEVAVETKADTPEKDEEEAADEKEGEVEAKADEPAVTKDKKGSPSPTTGKKIELTEIKEKIDSPAEKVEYAIEDLGKPFDTTLKDVTHKDKSPEPTTQGVPKSLKDVEDESKSPKDEEPKESEEVEEPKVTETEETPDEEDDHIEKADEVEKDVQKDEPAEEDDEKASEFKEVYDYSHPFAANQYAQELRETHITTLDSPITEKGKLIDLQVIDKPQPDLFDDSTLNDIKEEDEDHVTPPRDDGSPEHEKIEGKSTPLNVPVEMPRASSPREEEVFKIVANVAEVLKSEKDISDIIPDFDEEELEKKLSRASPSKFDDEAESTTVQRMLVTASSEDGGEEIEICAEGTIKFSPVCTTPDGASGKETPVVSHEISEQNVESQTEVSASTQLDLKEAAIEIKTSSSSIDEKEQFEIAEKHQKVDIAEPVEKADTPKKTQEEAARKESTVSEVGDLLDDARRESAISTLSERDFTKEETSTGFSHSDSPTEMKEEIVDKHLESDVKIVSDEERPASSMSKHSEHGFDDQILLTDDAAAHHEISGAQTLDVDAPRESSSRLSDRPESVISHFSDKTEPELKEPCDLMQKTPPDHVSPEKDEKTPSSGKSTGSPSAASLGTLSDEKADLKKSGHASPIEEDKKSEEIEEKTAVSRPISAASSASADKDSVVKAEEKVLSETAKERSDSIAKLSVDDKQPSRPESVQSEKEVEQKVEASEKESVEAAKSRSDSIASHVIVDDKQASRPASTASDGKETAKEIRSDSVASKTSAEKEPVDDKQASRPASAVSDDKEIEPKADEKDSLETEKAASRPVSSLSGKEIEETEKERKDSIASAEKPASEKSASRPASVASGDKEIEQKDDKSRPVSALSGKDVEEAEKERKASVASAEKPSADDKQASSRPESAASAEITKEIRSDSVASKTSAEKQPVGDKQASRPASSTSGEKETAKDVRSDSIASHVSAEKEVADDKKSSRPASAVSGDKESLEKEEATSRPISALSGKDVEEPAKERKESVASAEKPIPDEKDTSSRPQSSASGDDKQASRPASSASTEKEAVLKTDATKIESVTVTSVETTIVESSETKIEEEATSRPVSSLSGKDVDEAEKERKASIASSEKPIADDKQASSRPESAASVEITKEIRSDSVASKTSAEKEPVDDKQASRPASSASGGKETTKEVRSDSIASHVSAEKEAVDDKKSSRPASAASGDKEIEQKSDEKDASRPVSALSGKDTEEATKERPESATSQASAEKETLDDKKSSRSASTGSTEKDVEEKPSIDKSGDTSRPLSALSDKEVKEIVKERSESIASHSSVEKTIVESVEVTEEIRSDSVASKTSAEKEPVDDKQASRPASAVSDDKEIEPKAEEKESLESEKAASRPVSSLSGKEIEETEKERKDSIASAEKPASEKSASRPASVASGDKEIEQKDDKSRPVSALSAKDVEEAEQERKASIASVEKPSADDKQASSRPESAASAEITKEIRSDSVASKTSAEKESVDDKQASRPVSSASGEKETTKDVRSDSIASHVSAEKEAVDDKKSSRPASAVSGDKDSLEKEEPTSRPISSLSGKEITEATKERSDSIASHTNIEKTALDGKQATANGDLVKEIRSDSIESHVSVGKDSLDVKSRPESAQSDKPGESPRPLSSASGKEIEGTIKERSGSVASHVSAGKESLDEKKDSRPVSSASGEKEKEIADKTSETSRPVSALSEELKEATKTRSESIASHVSVEKVSVTKTEDVQVVEQAAETSRPVSSLSGKEIEQTIKERSDSVASHTSVEKTTAANGDLVKEARSESIVSHTSVEKAASDKSASRPASVASGDKEIEQKDDKSRPVSALSVKDVEETEKERKASVASAEKPSADDKQASSRPESAASAEITKDIRSDSVASKISAEKEPVDDKQASRPASSASGEKETAKDVRSDSIASHASVGKESLDEKQASSRPASAASGDKKDQQKTDENDASRPVSSLSGKDTEAGPKSRSDSVASHTSVEKTILDEKHVSTNGSLVKEIRSESIVSHVSVEKEMFDDKKSSRPESAASVEQKIEKSGDTSRPISSLSGKEIEDATKERKESVASVEKQTADDKVISSRPQSSASGGDKPPSRPASSASTEKDIKTEVKEIIEKTSEIVEQISQSVSDDKKPSRPESAASNGSIEKESAAKVSDKEPKADEADTEITATQVATGSTIRSISSSAYKESVIKGDISGMSFDEESISHSGKHSQVVKETRSKSVASISVFGIGKSGISDLEQIVESSKDDSVVTSGSRKPSDISTLIEDVKKIDEKISSSTGADSKKDQPKEADKTSGEEKSQIPLPKGIVTLQTSSSSSTESVISTKTGQSSMETVIDTSEVAPSKIDLKHEEYAQDVSSPRSDISSGQASRIITKDSDNDSQQFSDDDIAASPKHKFSYDEYHFERSGSGVSKKSDLDIDEAQNDMPPQYGSREAESAISISSTYKVDPMSTSFYGELPSSQSTVTTQVIKSEPITVTTVRTVITKQYDEHSSGADDSSSYASQESFKFKPADHKFLDEADMDFEKALEEHKKVRGTEVMSSVTSKYEFTPAQFPLDTLTGATEEFTLSEVKPTKVEKEVVVVTTTTKTATSSEAPASTVTETVTAATTAAASTAASTAEALAQQIEDNLKKAEERVASWGKPLGLPSPIPITDNPPTPKKERKLAATKTKLNNEKNIRKRADSPNKTKKSAPIYMDLTYVPHNGNSYYSHVEFFKRVRARYYVFSGTEPSREVYNALLEAKQTWEDKDLEVTIIPTYDTDVLGYWVTENEELLAKYHIDLSPSASRCTINLQDHETSCSAYRLEF